jgi:hypothetical protein
MWDAVNSRDSAERQIMIGKLRRVLLLPLELGGEDTPANLTYLPTNVADAKDEITKQVLEAVRCRQIDRITVTPDYRGGSFVPATLKIEIWLGQSIIDTRILEVW